MAENKFAAAKKIILFLLLLIFVLFLHGAIPFLAVPTLGQAVWTAGFAQSFVNAPGISIFAANFGLPQPSAIAFGLSGALPTGLFISMGLHPADAYATMAAMWLTIGFFSAWRLAMWFELRFFPALLAAVLWMSMPIIWAHAGYSMLSLGIALLPFYFLAAIALLTKSSGNTFKTISKGLGFVSVCLIVVFMDGYSFMMFAAGTGLLGVYVFLRRTSLRRYLVSVAFPFCIIGFGLAYVLYVLYIGKPQFDAAPLDFFRGWGVDLAFLAIPTKGMHWFWDAFGLSVTRSGQDFFGDASVWMTTFLLPVIIAGLFGWWYARKKVFIATGVLLMALFGLYMAMGPSLKINSTRPEQMFEKGQTSPMMPEELAIGPTGNAFLSKYVPGFKNMRAAYRWMALSMLGFWLLVALAAGKGKFPSGFVWSVLIILIICNLPHISIKWETYKDHREAFLSIDADLVSDMEKVLEKREWVAFLPYRNDFLANYSAYRKS